MPTYRVEGMLMHLKLGKSKRPPPVPCAARIPNGSPVLGSTMRCCAISSYLCDWQLPGGGTCDAPLCVDHPQEVGPDRHLCPTHAAQREET